MEVMTNVRKRSKTLSILLIVVRLMIYVRGAKIMDIKQFAV